MRICKVSSVSAKRGREAGTNHRRGLPRRSRPCRRCSARTRGRSSDERCLESPSGNARSSVGRAWSTARAVSVISPAYSRREKERTSSARSFSGAALFVLSHTISSHLLRASASVHLPSASSSDSPIPPRSNQLPPLLQPHPIPRHATPHPQPHEPRRRSDPTQIQGLELLKRHARRGRDEDHIESRGLEGRKNGGRSACEVGRWDRMGGRGEECVLVREECCEFGIPARSSASFGPALARAAYSENRSSTSTPLR